MKIKLYIDVKSLILIFLFQGPRGNPGERGPKGNIGPRVS